MTDLSPVDFASQLGPNAGQLFDAQQKVNADLAFQAQQRQVLAQQQQYEQQQQQAALAQAQRASVAQAAYKADHSAANFSRLLIDDPTHLAGAKASYDALQDDDQKQRLVYMTAVRNYVDAGQTDKASALIQMHVDADRRQGRDTTIEQSMLDALSRPSSSRAPFDDSQGGDPSTVKTIMNRTLATLMGPEKYAEVFGKLSDDDRASAEEPGKVAQQGATLAGTNATTAATQAKTATEKAELPYVAPGKVADIALKGAQARQAEAGARKDAVQTVKGADGGETLVDIGGGGAAGAPAPASPFPTHDEVTAALPGVRITSGARTAEHNAAVGGVPNSYHLTGQAFDMVPPDGVSMTQLAVQAKRAFPNLRVLPEGDHVHIQPDHRAATPAAQPGVRVLYQSQESPEAALTPAAIEQVAQQYQLTGTLPALGYGNAATMNRNAVLNRSAEIQAETGLTGQDAVLRHAQIKSQAKSLGELTSTSNLVAASEDTINRNLDYALSLAPRGAGPTGSPMLNAPIQYLRKQVWGSTQVAGFDQAIGTVADEYAKAMTTRTGSGGAPSSDSARKEAYARLSKASSLAQLKTIAGAMQTEIANRHAGLTAQIDGVSASIRNGGVAPPGPAASAAGSRAPVQVRSLQEARALAPGTSFVTPDGRGFTR